MTIPPTTELAMIILLDVDIPELLDPELGIPVVDEACRDAVEVVDVALSEVSDDDEDNDDNDVTLEVVLYSIQSSWNIPPCRYVTLAYRVCAPNASSSDW